MKKKQNRKPSPARGKFTILAQLCNLIPGYLVAKLSRECGVQKHARTFSAWSHVVSLLYAQLAHALSMRRVRALVEVDGKQREMEFLTNNFEWSAETVAELYKSRWQIEVFFKQIKQTLQLCDFLGNSASAVHWQIWTALLLYVLMRFQAFLHGWHWSFTRLLVLWDRFEIGSLLRFHGTATGPPRPCAAPVTGWLPGFEPEYMGQHA